MSSLNEKAKTYPKIEIEYGKNYLLEIKHEGMVINRSIVFIDEMKIRMPKDGLKSYHIKIKTIELE